MRPADCSRHITITSILVLISIITVVFATVTIMCMRAKLYATHLGCPICECTIVCMHACQALLFNTRWRLEPPLGPLAAAGAILLLSLAG